MHTQHNQAKPFINFCRPGSKRDPQRGPIHTSTAVVVVFITDVNDNKPIFQDCGSYGPKIEEGAPNGSPVIKVHAVDEDKGVNGQVCSILTLQCSDIIWCAI